jgi:N-hydroxyarylamine O-acetyltransferase
MQMKNSSASSLNIETDVPESLFDRYLKILGLERVEPSLDYLFALNYAHLTKIPFENLSKLYYGRVLGINNLPGLERYLNGIAKHNFGGTCYTSNYYFNLLLNHLGFKADLCGSDMNNPDVHLVNIVTVEGDEYLLDMGYAAPFYKPMPRSLAYDFTIEHGLDKYILKPMDKNGYSRIVLMRDGEEIHGYLAKPTPRKIDCFEETIWDSFTDNSTFMNSLLMVRFYENYTISIRNKSAFKISGSNWEEKNLENLEELTEFIVTHFNMPIGIVQKTLNELKSFDDPWS